MTEQERAALLKELEERIRKLDRGQLEQLNKLLDELEKGE